MSRRLGLLLVFGAGLLLVLHFSYRMAPVHHAAASLARKSSGMGGGGLAALVDKGPEFARGLVRTLILPQKIDDVVTLESAASEGPIVVIAVSVNSLKPALDMAEATRIANSVCSDSRLATSIVKGVMLEYRYTRSSDGLFLGTQDIAAIQCLLHDHPEMARGSPLLASGWQGNAARK